MVIDLIGRIKEGVFLTFTALKSGDTAKDVGKEFAKIVPVLDKLIESLEKTRDAVERNEIIRFYRTVRDASKEAGIGDAEIDFRKFLSKLKEEFETFNLKNWSRDPIDVPGATLVLEMAGVKDYSRIASYYYHFRRLFIENFRDYYEELKTRDGKIKFLEKLEEAKRFADYRFLEKLEGEIGEIPPIKEYYQPNPCCQREYDDWIEGAKRDCLPEKSIRKVIYDFITSNEQALLLAADFGIGKTTTSRYFVSELAKEYYEHGYLPLYFRLSDIGTTPPKIKRTIKDVTTMYEKTLIVLDGLDEISGEKRDAILDFVDNYLSEHRNTKIIVASRFGIYSEDIREAKEFLFDKLGIRKYYQLMPLTEELARNMLEKLGGLSFDEVKILGISEEEYTKPIYLYLLWVLKKAGKIEKLRGFGKSGIYLALTNLVSRYKAKCVEDEEIKKELKEKSELKARNVLIHIAVLRTVFESEKLSREEIRELLSDDIRKDLDKIGSDFLITTYLRNPDDLTFIHKSFQEYLSAEFLLMNFLSGRYEGLYAFPLTQEILEFLRSLARMLRECIKSGNAEEFRELFELIDKKSEDLSVDNLITKAKEHLRERYYLPFFENVRCSGLNFKFCKFKDVENVIKIFVSGKVAVMEIGQAISENEMLKNLSKKDKSVIGEILRYNYLSSLNLRRADLSRANLSKAKLIGVDLRKADLSGADLSEANLSGADLSKVALSGADLRKADLSGAKLIGVYLRGADLSRAVLSNADLREANLSRAVLIGVDLRGADLSEANLSWANLNGANLSRAVLIDADLNGAVLSNADLREANLRDAYLSWVVLSGANLSKAKLNRAYLGDISWKDFVWKFNSPAVKGANFENAKINDREFVEYLRKNGAINVPDPVED